ncbi:hypothetical protein KY382_28930 [Pseudomonas monteilii]|nr:hypothetical protein [Enterococcus innesii]MCT8192168.1 hypothetical protein [Pseudomonas monteilii]
MKKIFLFVGAFCFLFLGADLAYAEMEAIDVSLAPEIHDLSINPEAVDLDSFIMETDEGNYQIIDDRLVPTLDRHLSILPFASTATWEVWLQNGQQTMAFRSAWHGQRITYGTQPIGGGTRLRTRDIRSANRVYITSTSDAGRMVYQFNAAASENITFSTINHSNASGFTVWITM